ncbi:hypothetical protein CWI36_0110p0020 [Hamiltosporidium magnivora]|uniref:Uncharacterized protein n=1 Tax=Hamiltosporidium magnivora TaxID=148818 RepID=A0A4Q9LKD9_9MICR|nr:hypothetical protein CWI36_0110p0020 [Hamiltosporidium magnivora]
MQLCYEQFRILNILNRTNKRLLNIKNYNNKVNDDAVITKRTYASATLGLFEKSKEISTRRAAILKVENNNQTHLALIQGFLNSKKNLKEAQLSKLYKEIEKRKLHSKLCNARKKRACKCYEMKLCSTIFRIEMYYREQMVCANTSINLTRIKTDVKIQNNRPDIFILDKKKNKITHIKVGIIETEKPRKYDSLPNELGLFYKFIVEIIPCMMRWDGIVKKCHKMYVKRLQIFLNVEAYMQSIVVKKKRTSLCVILEAEMHKQPTPLLKQLDNEEVSVKTENKKNIIPLILDGVTTAKEPSINANEELVLKEEIEVVGIVERTI